MKIFHHISKRYLSSSNSKASGVLRIHGPDQKGIVAASSKVLDSHGFSISKSEQFTDDQYFYQRSLFQWQNDSHRDDLNFDCSKSMVEADLLDLKDRFGLSFVDVDWRVKRKKIAIFVSKYDHCLASAFFSLAFLDCVCNSSSVNHLMTL